MSRRKNRLTKLETDQRFKPFFQDMSPNEIWSLGEDIRLAREADVKRISISPIAEVGLAQIVAPRQTPNNRPSATLLQSLIAQKNLEEQKLAATKLRQQETLALLQQKAEENQKRLELIQAQQIQLNKSISTQNAAKTTRSPSESSIVESVALSKDNSVSCESLGPLTNLRNGSGSDCFADSVLTALFAVPNEAVRKAFLDKNPEQLLICDIGIKDQAVRQSLKDAVINYNDRLHLKPTAENASGNVCMNIRRFVASCRKEYQQFGPDGGNYGQQDPTEFWVGLCAIFQFEPMMVQVERIFNDGRATEPTINTQPSFLLSVPDSLPVTVSDQDTEVGELSTVVSTIIDASFIVIQPPRYSYDAGFNKVWRKRQYLVPNDSLRLTQGNGLFELQSFVVYSGWNSYKDGQRLPGGGHYISYVRCGPGKWLLFNDLGGPKPVELNEEPRADLEYGSVLMFFKKVG